ncbi:MAG: glycosyltransferase [Leptospiraceae bacterium]|nr:glycosyltransferase [Leptospiraceae bacterium]
MADFEDSIHRQTWGNHESILRWAENRAARGGHGPQGPDGSDSLTVLAGELRQKCIQEFHNSRVDSKLRIAMHVPPFEYSPGGASLFNNLKSSLDFIGIQVQTLPWQSTETRAFLERFQPNIVLTSDSEDYLRRIDWDALAHYRRRSHCLLGLTASIEAYGNPDLTGRLENARKRDVSFYYSFRTPEYLQQRIDYAPFFDRGFRILSVEFGANILNYFPIGEIEPDLDYVFLASSNPDKWPRYFAYLPAILSRYPGFLDGPGWAYIHRWAPPSLHRYLYARAKVGINLHIQESIDWPCELNERTYILAASGVPQLVDRAKLLTERFSPESMYIADTPEEYLHGFERLRNDRQLALEKSHQAMRDVYSKHTTFHRASGLAKDLESLLN